MRPPRIEIPKGQRPQLARPIFNRATGRAFDINAAEKVTEIDLYDKISPWGISAADFRSELRGIKGDIRLRINSPGGDVFDGIAIYNDLLAHQGSVNVEITGLAASAASIVAMAGTNVAIAENAFIMIHNAWALTMGDRSDHYAAGSVLETIDTVLARTYAKRSGETEGRIARLMDDETWFAGNEAVEFGLADEVTETAAVEASFDLSMFQHVPKALSNQGAERPHTIRDCERALRDAGFSRRDAMVMAKRAVTKTEPPPRDSGHGEADDVAAFRAALRTLGGLNG